MYNSILAISLNSYAFFGTSFTSAQSIEEAVKEKKARFVCLDLGRLSGMDCTFADQIRLRLGWNSWVWIEGRRKCRSANAAVVMV